MVSYDTTGESRMDTVRCGLKNWLQVQLQHQTLALYVVDSSLYHTPTLCIADNSQSLLVFADTTESHFGTVRCRLCTYVVTSDTTPSSGLQLLL